MNTVNNVVKIGLIVVGLLSVVFNFATAGLTPKEIYQHKASGVVLIMATEEGTTAASVGTGSIISKDGLVITNCHVIFNKEANQPHQQIHIFLKPEKVTGNAEKDMKHHYIAEIVQYSEPLDLALLQIKNPPPSEAITVIELGNPEDISPGDHTVAIGHPEQGGFWTLTTGVISNEIENFNSISGKDVFQMETSLNRGNSGGPLFDQRGYMIGVNTMIARKSADGLVITGINFAVKSSVLKKWLEENNKQIVYGLLPFDDVAIAKAYETKPPEQLAKLTETEQPALIPKADLEQVEGVSAQKKRFPRTFVMDFKQTRRPYKIEKVYSKYLELQKKSQKALDELDQELKKQK